MGLLKCIIEKQNKERERLLKWQSLVSPETKLFMNKNQLISASTIAVQRDQQIIKDCLKILETTKNPDTFFERLDLLEEKSIHVAKFEPYMKFTGALPSQALKQFYEDKDKAISIFLNRYWDLTYNKITLLKTNKSKLNAYNKFKDSLVPYTKYFSEENLNFYNSKEKFILAYIDKT